MRWIWVLLFLLSWAGGQQVDLALSPRIAARGELVTAVLRNVPLADTKRLRVFVGGLEAAVQDVSREGVRFRVPAGRDLAGGPQPVVVVSGAARADGTLSVLGDVIGGEVLLTVDPLKLGDTQEQRQRALAERVRAVLKRLGYEAPERPVVRYRPLGGEPGSACGGDLAVIDVGGAPLGQVLEALEREDVVLHADPESGWFLDQVAGETAHLDAIGAPQAAGRFSGKGVTIAVLDTGVSASAQLGARLLVNRGYDFVDDDAEAGDAFSGGHGTPVALLAAGSVSGVARGADVLPVRVCDGSGVCLASNVILGVCHALTVAKPERLVLNLSLGGDTPVGALRAILAEAMRRGALIAAAAGNGGCSCRAARHYPAAYDVNGQPDLDGLLAVAAVVPDGGGWRAADFSTRGDYLDLAAPGVVSVDGSTYRGTSFATPLVAGALALWREAAPAWNAVQIEATLKALSLPLPGGAGAVGTGLLDLSVRP